MAGVPRARDGQIKAQWGKLADSYPDLCYVWGKGTSRADARLLHNMLSLKPYMPLTKEFCPSFLEELDARGYDITTLKISVEKKRDS